MTTNQERAQQIIAKWIDDNLPYSEGHVWADEAIAEALADAGLLMPDLPEPRDIGGNIACFPRGVEVWPRRTVRVYLADDYWQGEARLTPQEARAYGEELIAAANHAEQEQDHG